MLKKFLVAITVFLAVQTTQAAEAPCYVSIESPGKSYTILDVSAIAVTMIRQFIDPSVEAIPLTGISGKACMYRVNIVEKSEGLKAFIFGKKISDYGTSNLRGEAGLEQAILRAIYKGADNDSSQSAICQKYGKKLETECQGTKTIVQKSTIQSQPETTFDDQQPPTDNSEAGIFKHNQPSFTVEYPDDWIPKKRRRHPNVVFFATAENKKTPAMEVVVVKPRRKMRDRGIPRFINSQWQKRLPNSGNFKTIKAKRLTLKDGTSAYFYVVRLKPNINQRRKITASYIIAEKQEKVVMVSAWTLQKGRAVKDINRLVKSLRFQ